MTEPFADALANARPRPTPPPSPEPPPRSDWFRYLRWRAANDACSTCGRNLHDAGVNNLIARYCSNACRQRAYRRRKRYANAATPAHAVTHDAEGPTR